MEVFGFTACVTRMLFLFPLIVADLIVVLAVGFIAIP